MLLFFRIKEGVRATYAFSWRGENHCGRDQEQWPNCNRRKVRSQILHLIPLFIYFFFIRAVSLCIIYHDKSFNDILNNCFLSRDRSPSVPGPDWLPLYGKKNTMQINSDQLKVNYPFEISVVVRYDLIWMSFAGVWWIRFMP